MSEIASRRNDCRLCHSRVLDLVLKLTPTPLADLYLRTKKVQSVFPLDLYLCRECGFAQLLDVVQPQAIYVNYIYETVSSLGLVEHFDNYAEEVLRRICPPPGALVIDIGSNDGTLLRSYHKRGMKVLGVDPAREIARRATAAGVETLAEFLTVPVARRIRQEYGPAAIVCANNVVANIDDLEEIAAAIRELLGPDGVFVFESYYLGDLVRNMVFDFIYHEHISSFSVKPIELFFRRHGFELIDTLRVPTKGGSLRYTIQLANGPRKIAPVLGELLALEAQQGLDQPEMFRAFSARVEGAKQDTFAILQKLKVEGRQVAGYGASATTTTLMYHFGMAGLVDYLVDDNPAKQGTFSPGLHLSVFPPEVIYERRPDTIVVMAWRYYEPIVRRHHKYSEQGGRFIVPMPELRIL